jgi:hypothetical protein
LFHFFDAGFTAIVRTKIEMRLIVSARRSFGQCFSPAAKSTQLFDVFFVLLNDALFVTGSGYVCSGF